MKSVLAILWLLAPISWGNERHWAVRPLVRPKGDSVDFFARRKLDAPGLKPSPPAEESRLLRRVYLVKCGHVHGATDESGYRAAENKVHVHDLHTTVLHQLGIDHERLTYRHQGRDFWLTDVFGSLLHEILA